MSALKAKLVNVIYIRTSPRALWNALTQPQSTRQYYVGLELKPSSSEGEGSTTCTGPNCTGGPARAWRAS